MIRIFCGLLIATGLAFGQAPPAFEVASVKPSPPFQPGPGRSTFIGGPRMDAQRATWTNVPLRFYVMQAYGGTIAWRIQGGPAWFTSDNFDITATFPTGTTREQMFLMLRTLLAERFSLATHTETKEFPVYALTVAKGGLKVRESAVDDSTMTNQVGTAHMVLHKTSMQRLADLLSGTTLKMSDRPVVDMTGLKGVYDMTLDWAPDDAADTGKPSLFTAVSEQLGLHLEAQKAPTEFLVIDHAEKPAEN